MSDYAVDLPIDLNVEDDSGLPWAFLDEAPEPDKIREGAWTTVGSRTTQAVAQVADIADVVHVRPLSGPVARHAHLLDPVA